MRRVERLIGHLEPDTATLQTSLHTGPTSATQSQERKGARAVIVAGCRTPFIKSFTSLASVSAIELGIAAIGGLIERTKLNPNEIDSVIYGNVVVNTGSPNVAREIILDLNLPRTIPGSTVSMACMSGLECVDLAVQSIETGRATCVIAGGTDSTSNAEMPMKQHVTKALAMHTMGGGNKQGFSGMLQLVRSLGMPWSWLPNQPTVSERSTGKTMGYHTEMMAELIGVSRQEQDEWAVQSHSKASAARKSGTFDDELVPVKVNGKLVKKDNIIRDSIDISKLAQLAPAFRPSPVGTITAASASALTDGASAVLVMSESKARSLGYPTDISVRAYHKCAFEPFPHLLLAPAIAIPLALKEANLSLNDIDLFEIHEAFAGQVLSTLKVLEDDSFYQQHLNIKAPGRIDRSKINLHGSSLALGHPFAATGGRLVTSASRLLRQRDARYALISICAAGGMGGVMILERTKPTAIPEDRST